MKKKGGFTLVELLVVMAIIAILASIVVPNVIRYIARARLTRALSEVSGMELSLTAIMTDAGRGNMSQLFNKDAAPNLGWPTDVVNITNGNAVSLFESAADVYAKVTYNLVRLGRDSLSKIHEDDPDVVADVYIQHDILAKLGTQYMDIGLDSWGQVYRMWPGPWRFSTVGITPQLKAPPYEVKKWPIPFRLFSVDMGGEGASAFAVQRDRFILKGTGSYLDEKLNDPDPEAPKDGVDLLDGVVEDPNTWPTQVSLPASSSMPVYIWSYGDNARSSQMLYQATYNIDDPWTWFYTEMEADIAGGDDVNNWDSGNSWQRFYQ